VKFKLDENLPVELLDDLRAAGHETESVPGERLTGAEDSVHLDHVRREGRVLLTMDKGIGDVRAYPPHLYAGIVLFRPPSSGRPPCSALFNGTFRCSSSGLSLGVSS
jgi:hypothetical protein